MCDPADDRERIERQRRNRKFIFIFASAVIVALLIGSWSNFRLAVETPSRTRPADGSRQHAPARRPPINRVLPQRCLSAPSSHRCVELSGHTLVPWFRSKVKCAMCGARHSRIDVRPNWKEASRSRLARERRYAGW